MNNLLNLISDIELAIRYLLSGVAITAIYLFSKQDFVTKWEDICKHQALALFLAGALGFAVFTLYRILYWIIADEVTWWTGVSADSLDRDNSISRPEASARFLQWRRAENFNKSLNGYLHYRWAVVHFTFIFALALAFFSIHCEPDSLMKKWSCCGGIASIIFIIAALRQSWFLFRVEKALYSDFREKKNQSNKPTDDSKR